MVPRRTTDPAGRRLTKAEVETLFERYDDDPSGALAEALRVVLGRPAAPWPDLLDDDRLAERRTGLERGEIAELDRLARDLNELRQLPPG